eukprot:Lankesteria_metandrocarpae@DN4470_c0_g1_i1.p1
MESTSDDRPTAQKRQRKEDSSDDSSRVRACESSASSGSSPVVKRPCYTYHGSSPDSCTEDPLQGLLTSPDDSDKEEQQTNNSSAGTGFTTGGTDISLPVSAVHSPVGRGGYTGTGVSDGEKVGVRTGGAAGGGRDGVHGDDNDLFSDTEQESEVTADCENIHPTPITTATARQHSTAKSNKTRKKLNTGTSKDTHTGNQEHTGALFDDGNDGKESLEDELASHTGEDGMQDDDEYDDGDGGGGGGGGVQQRSIDLLKRQIDMLNQKVSRLESFKVDDPFQEGETVRERRHHSDVSRYLTMNRFGIIVTRYLSTTGTQKHSSVIEVHRNEASEGQKLIRVQNTIGYQSAALGLSGYALFRRGWYEGSTAAFKGDWQASVLEFHTFAQWECGSKSWWAKQLPEGESILCVAVGDEFVAVATTERLLRIFTASGMQLHLTVTNGQPVTLSASDNLLLVTTMSPYTGSCTGAGNTSWDNKAGSAGPDKLYSCSLLELTSSHLLLAAELTAPESWGHLIWCGVSERIYPVLCFSSGRIFGLLPVLSSPQAVHPNSLHSVPNPWVPLADRWSTEPNAKGASPFGEAVCLQAVHQFVSLLDLRELQEKQHCVYWPLSVDSTGIEVLEIDSKDKNEPLVPPVGSIPVNSRRHLPFRLPLAVVPGTAKTVQRYANWLSRLKADPGLKDVQGVTSLPLSLLDSVQLLQQYYTRQLEFIKINCLPARNLSAGGRWLPDNVWSERAGEGIGSHLLFRGAAWPEDPTEQVDEAIYRLKASTDAQLFKLYVKALDENRLQLALDCIVSFKQARTLRHAHRHLSGLPSHTKSLALRVNEYIENQLSSEQFLIDCGIDIDANLRQLSMTTAFSAHDPPPLPVEALTRLYTQPCGAVATPATIMAHNSKVVAMKSPTPEITMEPSTFILDTALEDCVPAPATHQIQTVSKSRVERRSLMESAIAKL